MESPCQHAGCHLQAAWVCLLRNTTAREPYLCDIHWSVLSLRDADRAGSYVPLAPDMLRFRRVHLTQAA